MSVFGIKAGTATIAAYDADGTAPITAWDKFDGLDWHEHPDPVIARSVTDDVTLRSTPAEQGRINFTVTFKAISNLAWEWFVDTYLSTTEPDALVTVRVYDVTAAPGAWLTVNCRMIRPRISKANYPTSGGLYLEYVTLQFVNGTIAEAGS